MERHFLGSPLTSFRLGHLHTLVTSAFSHKEPMHFFFNMYAFYTFHFGISYMSPAFFWMVRPYFPYIVLALFW